MAALFFLDLLEQAWDEWFLPIEVEGVAVKENYPTLW